MTNLFLRHAEVLNKKNIQYANLPGFQISDKGKEQSVAAGKLLKNSNKKIQKIITSPLLRARETSSIVFPIHLLIPAHSVRLFEKIIGFFKISEIIEEVSRALNRGDVIIFSIFLLLFFNNLPAATLCSFP